MIERMRRLRRSPALRTLVRETDLSPRRFVYPLFVSESAAAPVAIASMPGMMQWPLDRIVDEASEAHALGIGAVLLFGLPARKDAGGSEAYNPDGVVQRAVRAIKSAVPDLIVITDVCLCEYTDHGHCGLLPADAAERASTVSLPLNDPTLEVLAKIAVSHAMAGADVVAPSAMLDGMVGAIREALDSAGHAETPILSYSAKYASGFYGPFRDAAGGAPSFGDRRSHQMDIGNAREAIREHALDLAEGADMLMVKPALAYLDVIRSTRDHFPDVPLAAYNVSGEYAMVKAAAAAGWLDERTIALEILNAIRRAGADLIITYHAKDAARWLRD
jgi:porphobilinogen synthase